MNHESTPQVCPPEHAHDATTNCYTHHSCRCDRCRAGQTAAANARRRLKAYGRWVDPFVPVEPVREHIAHLRAYGMGLVQIAAVAGVSYNAIYAPVYGRKPRPGEPNPGMPTSRIKRVSADKILAVRADLSNMRPNAVISSRGVQRRIHALQARGWAFAELSRRIGIDHRSARFMQADRCTVRVHLAVEALYEQLWDKQPPRTTRYERTVYGKAINAAAAHGWLPPMAWDDIDNDPEPPAPADPDGVDEVAIGLVLSGGRARLTPAERRVALPVLHGRRWSDARIAAALGLSTQQAFRIRRDLGLPAFDQTELVRAVAA